MSTDSQGNAIFDIPFSAPAGLPEVTATATDQDGNTSEVSAERQVSFEVPAQTVRVAVGQPGMFSSASGDGIAIEDPDAGPLEPAWDLTLSVTEGSLVFSSLSGLTGSGDGTGMLQYSGSLSDLNAALGGLSFVQAAGTHGNLAMSLSAVSEGAPEIEAQVIITDGYFVVTTTADSGPGSLRQAIVYSNAAGGGTNTISFAIPGQGVQMIAPLSPLPAITNPVLIDGFSQPGYGGTPLIELTGIQAGSADGLTILCAGVTVRALDISDFASGAGIVITGYGAFGNTIENNVIGTDPTGSLALPNEFGVQILAGASDNLVGGPAAAAGNVIAFNTGPGVDVEGNSTLGNQITANRMFSNDDTGALQFNGVNYATLPNGLVNGSYQDETIEASFETSSGGVILGYQQGSPGSYLYYSGSIPLLYVGTDGKLYGGTYGFQVTSNSPVNDGRWHTVALVIDGEAGTTTIYLDGKLIGSASGVPFPLTGSVSQIGTGYSVSWPAFPPFSGWYGFVGQVTDVRIWSVALLAGEIQQDRITPPAATEPGLLADYTFDDGQGTIAHDLTANHNDATLASEYGSLPTWARARRSDRPWR